jgi:hypothetical protein
MMNLQVWFQGKLITILQKVHIKNNRGAVTVIGLWPPITLKSNTDKNRRIVRDHRQGDRNSYEIVPDVLIFNPLQRKRKTE